MTKAHRALAVTLVAVLLLGALALHEYLFKPRFTKYEDSFFDTFDTVITVVAYTKTKAEFNSYFKGIHQRFLELHKMFDIYSNYPGINNAKTINDNAGKAPVKVPKELVDLILFSKEWYERTGGKANIAMGSVLSIWHEYRQEALDYPEKAKLPPLDLLQEASKHTDIQKVVVDPEKETVYLADKSMSLDLGAVAKGYATELVAREFMAKGLTSAIINSGGNVRAIGKPLDGIRERWGIAIQDPLKSVFSDESTPLDVVYVNDNSVVSSGDYQRYYEVNGKRYHHIIDPLTLMPADYFHAVTVVTKDSGLADFLSTTLFLYPFNESKALAEKLGVDAIWVLKDGSIHTTPGFRAIAKSGGASGAKQ